MLQSVHLLLSRTLAHGVGLEVLAFADANEVETFVFVSATLAAGPELDAFKFAVSAGVSESDVSGSSLKSRQVTPS